MRRKIVLIAAVLLLNGCGISGHYRSSGPCKGFHKDQQACQRAAENSSVIGKVNLGQSLEEVRKIMGKDPERREVTKDSETWGYLTSYADYRFTTVIFRDGVVTEIRQ